MYIPAAFHGHRKDYSSNYFTASEQTKKPEVRKIPMDNVHKEGCKKKNKRRLSKSTPLYIMLAL